MTRRSRLVVLVVSVFGLAVALGMLVRQGFLTRPIESGEPEARASRLPSLEGAAAWINGGPLPADSLRGRIVVIVMWSDADPASRRALPDAEGWHRAYARFGVRVIGVHAPDFTFAADTGVAARLVRRMGLTFPIALDPAYRIRGRLHNLERPGFVVADTAGRVVYQGSGTGAAAARALRELIDEVRPGAGVPAPSAVDSREPVSQERVVYLGTSRVEGGPLADVEPGREQIFTAQFRFQEEGHSYVPYPVGRWTPEAEGVVAARGGPANFISVRFDGGRAWVVMAPPPAGESRVWILGNDAWLDRAAAGADVRFDPRGASYVEVREPGLFEIARCAGSCVLKLSPDEAGLAIFSFAFDRP